MKNKELPAVRKVQKALIDSTATASDAASSVFGKIGPLLKDLDDNLGVSEAVKKTGKQVGAVVSEKDQEYHVSKTVAEIVQISSS